MSKRHAMVVVKSMDLADLFVVHTCKDDRHNDQTWLTFATRAVVGETEYQFSSMTMLNGVYTVETFLANVKENNYELMFACHNVKIADIGAVCEFATDNFFNQSVEVFF